MRLNILILLPRIPFPLRDGGSIAMHQTMEQLVLQGCKVSVLAMNTARHYIEENALPPIFKQLHQFKTVFINNTINPLSAFINLFTSQSYNISRFINKNYSKALVELLSTEEFDIVIFDSIYTSMYLKEVQEHSKAKCFCRVHNIEHLIWQGLAKNEPSFFKRKYLELLTGRLKAYEIAVLKEFDLLLPISKNEEKYFLDEKINSSYYLPFGVEPMEVSKPYQEENSIYHIGSMDWAPNLEGVEWFLKEVWKDLQTECPQLTLYLAGKNMPKHIFKQQNEQTKVVGEVEDVTLFSIEKNILIVPLLSGAGIRIKVIEAMALGKTIVSTSIGVEGIGVSDNQQVIIANTPEAFQEKIKWCFNNPELCSRIGRNAREFVCLHYQKKKIYADLIEGFQHLM